MNELAQYFYKPLGTCYEHFTVGPCEDAGKIFLPGGKCGCHVKLSNYHEETDQCYELGMKHLHCRSKVKSKNWFLGPEFKRFFFFANFLQVQEAHVRPVIYFQFPKTVCKVNMPYANAKKATQIGWMVNAIACTLEARVRLANLW